MIAQLRPRPHSDTEPARLARGCQPEADRTAWPVGRAAAGAWATWLQVARLAAMIIIRRRPGPVGVTMMSDHDYHGVINAAPTARRALPVARATQPGKGPPAPASARLSPSGTLGHYDITCDIT